MPRPRRADGMYNFMTDVHIHVGVGEVVGEHKVILDIY